MRLLPIPITGDALEQTAPHWLPFLPLIARRSKETVQTLLGRIQRREVRIALIEDAGEAVALLGVTLHYRGDDLIADWVWMAGHGRKQWEHLLPEFEQMLREAGCAECRPLCRPGWRHILERAGYKLTHVQMEKRLWADHPQHNNR
jgi:hypothetical protein